MAERRDQPGLFELAGFLVAVTGPLVDPGGGEETDLVVVPPEYRLLVDRSRPRGVSVPG